MRRNTFKDIPKNFMKKWQEIADLIANIIDVPAALIMKTEDEFMEVFVSSQRENNPYKEGDKEHWHGLYCETVIKSQKELLIPNALKDKNWDKNPDLKLGMLAYLGLPINFPDKQPFGTLCVLDNKENKFTAENIGLLNQFKNVIELDLLLIQSLDLKDAGNSDVIKKLYEQNEEYSTVNEELEQSNTQLFAAKEKAELSESAYRELFENHEQNRILLRTIIDSIPDAIYVKNLSLRKVLANKAECKNCGFEKEKDLIGKTDFDIYPPEIAEQFLEDEKKVIKEGVAVFNKEESIKNPNFQERYILTSKLPLYDEKGRIAGLVGIGRDITERKLAEKELLESSVRFKALHNASFGGIGIHDKGIILECNQGLSDLTGYSLNELIGMNGLLLIAPEHREQVMNNIATAYEKPYEAHGLRKNGEKFPMRLEARNIPYKGKQVRTVEFRDISRQKALENELIAAKERAEENERSIQLKNEEYEAINEELRQTNEELYQAVEKADEGERALKHSYDLMKYIIEHNRSSVAVHDRDYRYIYVSNSYLQEFNVKEKNIIGKHHYDVFPDLPQKWRDVHKKALAGEVSSAEDDPYYREDGTVEWTRWECRPWYEKYGTIGGFIVYTEVITERKKMELELMEAKEKAEKSEREIKQMYEELAVAEEQLRASHEELLVTSEALSENNIELTKAKEKAEEAGRILHEKNQEYEALNEELNQTNEELYEAKEKAEQNNRLKTAFLNNLSHEIRTPLNAICGFSAMLDDPNIDKHKREKFVSVIHQSSEKLLSVVSDILTISSLETNLELTHIEAVNINKICNELSAVYKQQAINQGISFNSKQEIADEESLVYTDKSKLSQILKNLISNALRFTHEGFVEFGYEYVEKQGQAFLQFYVKDTGIGIKPELHKKIFEHFRQADETIQRNYGGTGLGLSISKGFAELLGGKIWLESEEGKGSVFYFTIPYKPVNKKIKVPTEKKQKISSCKATILIAEDEEFNYLYIKELLSRYDCKIIHAKNGQEAVSFFKESPDISLILMDIKMPKMDGYTAAKIIKEINPNMPIIAQSAYALEHERAKYEGIFDAYLTKPIKEDDLLNKFCEYTDNK